MATATATAPTTVPYEGADWHEHIDPPVPPRLFGRNAASHPRRVRAQIRETAAVQMRADGASWDSIADALGLASPKVAYNIIRKWRSKQPAPAIDVEFERFVLGLQLEQLMWDIRTGQLSPTLANVMLRALNGRIQLFGLNAAPPTPAPPEHDCQSHVPLTPEESVAAAARLQQLAREAAEQQRGSRARRPW